MVNGIRITVGILSGIKIEIDGLDPVLIVSVFAVLGVSASL
jgi:hypothetical protein